MFFTCILAFTTLIIAASAAFFSVYGLAHIFAGVLIPIIVMGAALEAGKLVAASFLYRHWTTIGKAVRAYLFFAIIVLMTITSLGIFGYLTAAYQQDSIPLKEIAQEIESSTIERAKLENRNNDINKEIANLRNNIINGRIRLQQQRQPEIDANNEKIKALDNKISELNSKKLNTEAHIGPIIFVAKAINREPDEAVFWFTLLIMSVFDPLAVVLTIATNVSIKHHKEKKIASKKIIEAEQKQMQPAAVQTEHSSELSIFSDPVSFPTVKQLKEPVPTPIVVTETVVIDKTPDIEELIDKKLDADARRKAILAATRK